MQTPATPIHEAQRLRSLHRLGILDTVPDAAFDRFTQLASTTFNMPIALVSLVDRDRQWFKSRQGLEATETPRDISFCGHAILGDDSFVVRDAATDIRFHDNPQVAGEAGIRFYAGQPLHAPDGQRIGTLCVVDRRPRDFSAQDLELLAGLATRVEGELGRLAEAATDPLTRLANRQGFESMARHALAACRRREAAGCYGVIRLEGVDRLAPQFGEEGAKAVLRQFAEVFAAAFGREDILAHTAPGEFRFFTPGRGEAEVLDRLDELAQQSCGSVRGRSWLDAVWYAGTADIETAVGAGLQQLGDLASERLAFFHTLHDELQRSFASP